MTDPVLDGRAAIADVLVRYARCVDAHDVDAAGACFTEDARAEYDGRELDAGRAAIVGYLRERTARLRTSTHLMGNMTIDVDGSAARASTDAIAFLVLEPAPGTPPAVRVRGLRYDDELVCEGGCWRIARRVHRASWMFESPALDLAAHHPERPA